MTQDDFESEQLDHDAVSDRGPSRKTDILKKAALKGLVLSVPAYPFLVVMASLLRLFQNQAFSFFGFELGVHVGEHSSSATLAIRPEFAVSVLVLFLVSNLLIWAFERSLAVRKR